MLMIFKRISFYMGLICFYGILPGFKSHAQGELGRRLSVNRIEAYGSPLGDAFQGANFAFDTLDPTLLYTSALWIGGRDRGDTLRLAAMTYRQSGTDFFYGPNVRDFASQDTDALDTSGRWDQGFFVTSDAIDDLQQGGPVSNPIRRWPWAGRRGTTEPDRIAPFVDVDRDGRYDPDAGDYPKMKGTHSIFMAGNDHSGLHKESQAFPILTDVFTQMYAYDCEDTVLSRTLFITYQFINRGNKRFDRFYMTTFNDFDLGLVFNDFIGTDTSRNYVYVYNGDSNQINSPASFGADAPAMAVKYLNHPLAYSMYYNNNSGPTGNPEEARHYYHYMKATWKDGIPLTNDGEDGRVADTSVNPTRYAYPGDPLAPSGWNEVTAGSVPGDRRILATAGPFAFTPGDTLTLEVAYIVNRSTDSHLGNVKTLRNDAEYIQNLYDQGRLGRGCETLTAAPEARQQNLPAPEVYPNPARSHILLHTPQSELMVWRLYNSHGQEVMQDRLEARTTHRLPLPELAPGVYPYQLSGVRRNYLGKLIIR